MSFNPRNLISKQYLDSTGLGVNNSALQSDNGAIFISFPTILAEEVKIEWISGGFEPTLLNVSGADDLYFSFDAEWRRPSEAGFPIIYNNTSNGFGDTNWSFTDTLSSVADVGLINIGDNLNLRLIFQSSATSKIVTCRFYFSVYQLNTGDLNIYMYGSYKEI